MSRATDVCAQPVLRSPRQSPAKEESMRRLAVVAPVLLAVLVGALPAHAWTWPVEGPVLRPFQFGRDPYASGQHRGVDVGAPAGSPVRAPASGTVTFAGVVPHGGRALTITT